MAGTLDIQNAGTIIAQEVMVVMQVQVVMVVMVVQVEVAISVQSNGVYIKQFRKSLKEAEAEAAEGPGGSTTNTVNFGSKLYRFL